MYQVKRAEYPQIFEACHNDLKMGKEILSYFRAFLRNWPAEGITNKMKLIKRVTYGLPNFERLRARILIECGCPP